MKRLVSTVFVVVNLVSLLLLTPLLTDIRPASISDLYQNQVIDPEALNYSPLVINKHYSTTVKAKINYFGSINLYFKPTSYIDPADIIKEDNEEPVTESTAPRSRFRFLLQIYDEQEKNYIFNEPQEIFHNKENAISYPFGFPVQKNSKGKRYIVTIKPLYYNDESPEFMGIATLKDRPVITSFYNFPSSDIRNNPLGLINLLGVRINQILFKYSVAFFVYIINFIAILHIKNKKSLKKFLPYAVLANLLILNLYTVLSKFPNLVVSSPFFIAKNYSLLSLFINGFFFTKLNKQQITYVHFKDEKLNKNLLNATFPTKKRIEKVNSFLSKETIRKILLITIFLSYLYFTFYHLGKFMSVDEPKWLYGRVPQLYEAIKHFDPAKTYINDKPGILPAFLAGFVNLFTNVGSFSPLTIEHYLFFWRLPIVIFNFYALVIIYHLLSRLFDRWLATSMLAIIALNPIIIGISQIVNPDATLWSTSFISFLYFILFQKTDKKIFMRLSGISLGLALLSKYFAAFIYIVFLLYLCLEFITLQYSIKHFNWKIWNLLKIIFLSVVIYTIFFPYTWTHPKQIYIGTIGGELISKSYPLLLFLILLTLANSYLFKNKIIKRIKDLIPYLHKIVLFLFLIFFSLLIINIFTDYNYFDPFDYYLNSYLRGQGPLFSTLTSSFYHTVLTLTPIHLGIILFDLIGLIFVISKKTVKNYSIYISLFSIYILILFLFGSALSGYIADTRYQIMLLPFYSLIALVLLNITGKIKPIASFLLVALSIYTIASTTPFYLHYTNFLNYNDNVVTDAWGYGGYELAQKVNSLPNAEKLNIWTDREGFEEFSISNIYWRGKDNPFETEKKIDYLILTRGGYIIFNYSLIYPDQYPELYLTLTNKYNIIDFYNKESVIEFNINGNRNNYLKMVEFKD